VGRKKESKGKVKGRGIGERRKVQEGGEMGRGETEEGRNKGR